jgi:proline iminopeptidase
VRAFCDALGIARPIVHGASFGGMVALAYATRHPDHPGRLILVSTEAAGSTHRERRVALFERFGGPEVGALARRRFLEGHTDEATLEAWLPRTPRAPHAAQRAVRRPRGDPRRARARDGRDSRLHPRLTRAPAGR